MHILWRGMELPITLEVDRDSSGNPRWAWRKNTLPVDVKAESKLLASRKLSPREARYHPIDVDTGKAVKFSRGTVNWNAHRNGWILIGGEVGGTSNLGEIWYAEASSPTGPWRRAKKIVTHDRYSFYNPVHHALSDQEGGRKIYFEGTYVTTFSGNQHPTPRYDYNQLLYRLDLADPRLRTVRSP